MFERRPFAGLIVANAWAFSSALYYTVVYMPANINLLTNLVCGLFACAAIMALPPQFMALKTYIVGICVAAGLASLQVSYGQPAFTPAFLTFLFLHFGLLGFAVAIGSLAPALPEPHYSSRAMLANLAVYAFIAIGVYVALRKGVRLADFIGGERTSGDAYKVAGLSGLQGILSIFLLCCFSLLSRRNKMLFLAAVLLFAILDVKRGEFVRVAMFLAFFVAIVAPKRIVWIAAIGAGILAVFVIAGEARQGLYSAGYSISNVLQSRVGNTAFDWAYGYFGITVSVLQEYFNSDFAASGYLPVLSSLVLDAPTPEFGKVSISGFNAATAFSIFAGQQSIMPGLDFLAFCVLVGIMVACAVRLQTPSLMAFVLLQIFGFAFGNQLFLPYYLAGFFAAVVYQSILMKAERRNADELPPLGDRRPES